MTAVERLVKEYNEGYPILCKLMDLSDVELKKTLKDLLGHDSEFSRFFEDSSDVIREYENEEPSSISLCWYGRMSISAFGIFYNKDKIVKFNKYFKLGKV
jgi:hypothetical protein